MRISELMTRCVTIIHPEASLQEAAAKMQSAGVGVLPVCGGDRLMGVITDRDITIRATAEGMDPSFAQVLDVMTQEIVSCFEDQLVIDAALLMQDHQLRRLLVLDRHERLVGIVSLADLANAAGEDELTESTLEAVSHH